ncbi:hypothetical protein FISHEDRAFT_20196, partial [Fistulina hepatica ATCC 64428]
LDDIDAGSERSLDSDDSYLQAQQEWEESLRQLTQLFSMVLMPLLGRLLGRRWSYWSSLAY